MGCGRLQRGSWEIFEQVDSSLQDLERMRKAMGRMENLMLALVVLSYASVFCGLLFPGLHLLETKEEEDTTPTRNHHHWRSGGDSLSFSSFCQS